MLSNNPYILFVGLAAFFLLWGARINSKWLVAMRGKRLSLFTIILIVVGGGCVLAVLHDAGVIS